MPTQSTHQRNYHARLPCNCVFPLNYFVFAVLEGLHLLKVHHVTDQLYYVIPGPTDLPGILTRRGMKASLFADMSQLSTYCRQKSFNYSMQLFSWPWNPKCDTEENSWSKTTLWWSQMTRESRCRMFT